jgi:hypothetical protein
MKETVSIETEGTICAIPSFRDDLYQSRLGIEVAERNRFY